jgi:hypothetical protein
VPQVISGGKPSSEQEDDMHKFSLGQIVATPGALSALEESRQAPGAFLQRHRNGDWGIVNADDRRANEEALQTGARLLSAYKTTLGRKIWVITEAAGDDGRRASACLLLPEDY